jgi:hypothetical protein
MRTGFPVKAVSEKRLPRYGDSPVTKNHAPERRDADAKQEDCLSHRNDPEEDTIRFKT